MLPQHEDQSSSIGTRKAWTVGRYRLSGARVAPGLSPSPTLPRDSPRGQEVKEGYKEEEAPSTSIEVGVGKLVSGLMRFTLPLDDKLVCNLRKH